MLRVFTIQEGEAWDNCIGSFPECDVYYLSSYCKSLKIHGDGEPLLLYFSNDQCSIAYPIMVKDISDSLLFQGIIKKGTYFDAETPYGYGGPIIQGIITDKTASDFIKELMVFFKERNIIAQFIRFDPLNKRNSCLDKFLQVTPLRETICINTDSKEVILGNMTCKCRNSLRKAMKLGVSVKECSLEEYYDFLRIYSETMTDHNADKYYIFSEDYFKSLINLGSRGRFFYASVGEKIISGALILCCGKRMHYHLAGTLRDYKRFASAGLILYTAALWGSKRGIKYFHLGGGMSSEDSLFAFKKQFNPKGRLEFCVGRTVFIKDLYNELISIRRKMDSSFRENNGYMLPYRKP